MSLFNTVTIQTPESVELEFTLAGIGNRALALMIDYLLLSLLLSVVALLAAILRAGLVNLAVFLGGGAGDVDLWLLAIAFLATAAIYGGYFVGFETGWQGQTPGKRFAKIRVIKDNGKPEGVFQAVLRALMRPVDDIFFIGGFCIVFSKQEKRVGDWLAGTLVVQSERPISSSTLDIPKASQDLAQQLSKTAAIGNLLPDDFAIVREYLQRRVALTNQARQDLSMQLAEQVRAIIELDQLPQAQMSSDTFLEAIYWAYQKQVGSQRNYR